MLKRIGLLVTGMVIGGLLAAGATVYAAGVIAEKSGYPFFLNGTPVTVDAYLINENNYFKLRDIAALADFGVTWDPETGSVYIDTTVGYTPEGQAQAEPEVQEPVGVDYSVQANPIIFTGPYTRDAYNALREAMLYVRSGPVSMTKETKTAMEHAEAAMGSFPYYELESAGNGEYYYVAKKSKAYTEAVELCQRLLASLEGKSDEEKLYAFACEISERLEYKVDAWTSPNTLFATPGPHKGNCTSYAHNFKFLCDMAGIPCVFVHSDIHQWNEVFVGDRWYSVDVGGFDVSYTTGTVRPSVLHEQSDMQGKSYRQTDPLLTLMAKELMVPGSTK